MQGTRRRHGVGFINDAALHVVQPTSTGRSGPGSATKTQRSGQAAGAAANVGGPCLQGGYLLRSARRKGGWRARARDGVQ